MAEPGALQVRGPRGSIAGGSGARDGAGHFVLTVVSGRFSGLGRVGRHRLVYDLLAELFQSDIHALTLTLLAPDEHSSAVGIPAPIPDARPGGS